MDERSHTWPTKTVRVRKWARPLNNTVRQWGGYPRRWPKAVTLTDMRPGRTYRSLWGRVVVRSVRLVLVLLLRVSLVLVYGGLLERKLF